MNEGHTAVTLTLCVCVCVIVLPVVQEDDFVARDDFEDADQLRIGNDGIFMLTFFSKISVVISTDNCGELFSARCSWEMMMKLITILHLFSFFN